MRNVLNKSALFLLEIHILKLPVFQFGRVSQSVLMLTKIPHDKIL